MAFQRLVKNLAKHGYEPIKFTPGLWRHRSRPATFTLCVDDFGVKYFSKADANHLIAAVKIEYECTVDWSGSLYCGLNLKWNYDEGYVDVSMDGYVKRALKRFKHVPSSSRIQHAPHPWTAPIYGKETAQQPTMPSSAPLLDKTDTQRIQAIIGTFIHYANIDPCIKPALNEIGTVQASPTTDTTSKVQMLMVYLHDHPDGVLRYHASDMILLVLPKARSRAAAWFIIGNDPTTHPSPMDNAPIYMMCNTIKYVMSSAAEAETDGNYMATQRACPIRVTLAELGHPQPTRGTPIYNDNSTATGILNSAMRQKLSKAFDMRFYWVKDRIQQSKSQLIWGKGAINMADYFTKHHPPWHHKKMRYRYLHKRPGSSKRGCVSIALTASPLTYPLLS
jgi:hypothetical protein